jgi:hypothetical protein
MELPKLHKMSILRYKDSSHAFLSLFLVSCSIFLIIGETFIVISHGWGGKLDFGVYYEMSSSIGSHTPRFSLKYTALCWQTKSRPLKDAEKEC